MIIIAVRNKLNVKKRKENSVGNIVKSLKWEILELYCKNNFLRKKNLLMSLKSSFVLSFC